MMKYESYLGIIDWGIGGVSIYKQAKARFGNIPILYFSDTGATPYGRMSRTELVLRLNKVVDSLFLRGVTHFVIGCNAASTVIPHLDSEGVKIEGMIESAVGMTSRMRPRRLVVIGGRRTVLSGVYRHAFAKHGIKIEQRIAQPLSGLIESGDVSSPGLRKECTKILAPIRNCSHLLLACTHYPAITSILKELVSADTRIIDPANGVVEKIGRWNLSVGGKDKFVTTGDPEKMKLAAWNAFGVRIKTVQQVTLDT